MIQIGLPVQIFRALTLGLSLGDEIGLIVYNDGILAVAKSPGQVSAGIIKISKEGLTDFIVKDVELPYRTGMTLSRLVAFARGCKKTKGSEAIIKIDKGFIEYIYRGDRYRYLRDRELELGWNAEEFANQLIELMNSIMKEGYMISVATKLLKQSLQDVRKYMKSGEVGFAIEGDKVLMQGEDEVTRWGFGLTAISGLGEVKKMKLYFSMDVIKDLVNAMVEAGDTVNIFVVKDKPTVFQIPMAGGEALYAAVPRI